MNKNRFKKHLYSLAIVLLAGMALPSRADDGDLTLGAERRMGDGIAKQILRDPDYIDDPLLEEYVEGIWQSLLASARATGELSPEMYERFAWRVMMGRDRSVNAFALPGGYFGVHLGLIGLVATRDELASVLAHELSHVTQRHISRSISQQGRQTPVLIAAMVLGALAVRKSPDAVGAVMAGSQAVAMQSQLNYSRDMEREADRIGFNLMQPAGFAPQGFVAMFNQLQQSARLSDNGNYPYLRSHPMTSERIGDMQSRMLSQHGSDVVGTRAPPSTSSVMAHAMMAARARVLSDPGVDILRQWSAEPQKGGAAGFATFTAPRQAAVLYAAALASVKLREPERAKAYVARLKTVTAGDLHALRVTHLIAAELALSAGDAAPALALDAAAIASPNAPSSGQARPELFLVSKAQIANKQADKASQNLRTWVAVHPLDAPAWQLLGSAYAAMGQTLRATRAEAEAQVALLDYGAALDRFRAAQELVRLGGTTGTQAGRDFIEESIVDVRTRQVQELLKEQLKEEKEGLK
ncbi:MAG: M48 family metalloprotease [Burkholderiaceae bacterium]|nr:M48 family metalloprotease [Burkholderiaceae bacterium]